MNPFQGELSLLFNPYSRRSLIVYHSPQKDSSFSVLGNLITAYLDDLVHLVYSMDSHWSGPGGILPQTIQFKRHLPCMNGLPCLTLSVKCRSTSRTAVRPSSSAVLCMPGFHSKGVHAHCYPELIRKESIVLPHSRSSCQSTHFC